MAGTRPEPQDLEVLLKQLGNLVTPMAVRVAATLRLVDHINAGARNAAALAAVTGAAPGPLGRVIRHLTVVGVLDEDPSGTLSPTRLGLLLADDHPAQQRAWLDLTGAVAHADLSFVHLLEAVRTGRPAYPVMYGLPFWEDLSGTAELGASFDALMSTDEDGYDTSVTAVDWDGVRHVLDVGGGTGALLIRIARHAPHVRGTLLELAGPLSRAREPIEKAGLTDRIALLEADFFDPLPVRADVVAVAFVLLNWSDEDALRILRNCAGALEPGGRIMLIERLDQPDSAADPFFGTLLDLRMLAFSGGRVRTREEYTALAADAGLAVESVVPLKSPVLPFEFSLLVLTSA
ncbi:methyltransferase [Spirillospora sp. NPDC029432]|uniref:methyltransferase n=1 Tax=Spirillospora sp. NPDC029432 TaxID=3154599 RepID=UPI0034522FA4